MVAIKDEPKNGFENAELFSSISIENRDEVGEIYPAIMKFLRRRLSLFVWQGFFEPLSPVSFESNILTISAPSLFHRDWIQDHYLLEIIEAANNVLGQKIEVNLTVNVTPEKNPSIEPVEPVSPNIAESSLKEPASIFPLRHSPTENVPEKFEIASGQLNPIYSFDTFVPGPSNHMGFAACNAVAEQPGCQYSPLFLFGPVGIGKTHLLHAIGLSALSKNPKTRIVYMSAEQWVNTYIQAIRERKFEGFRKKFRNDCDILLIDDIQFLAGKDASQDEFFHTFNSLYQARKQIVVTSDKYPHEIEGLEERLKTRLSWGLIADIRPPEIETRVAILYSKAESCGIRLPIDVANYLASQITSSVRELEGALVRLSAFASVTKAEISLSQAKEYLSPVFRREGIGVSPEKICDLVANYYDLKITDLKGTSRQRQVTVARQIAMAICRSHLSLSLPEIGRIFGRDHSTVLSSLRRIENLKASDIGIQSVLIRLQNSLVSEDIYKGN